MDVNKTAFNLSFFFLILLSPIFLIGCSNIISNCNTNAFTKDGKCCENLCDLQCPNGYIEGTCNCECVVAGDGKDDKEDNSGINDIFDDNGDVSPPPIPN